MFSGKRIIITGATRGLGKQLSKFFFSEGADLVLVGRNLMMLEAVKDEIAQNGGVDSAYF